MKKIAKLIGKFLLGIIITLLIAFVILYLAYNEPLPQGSQSAKADVMARNMLTALNYEAYQNTRYLSWTFRGEHHYVWDKDQYQVDVSWDNVKVNLNLKQPTTSTVTLNGKSYSEEDASEYIETALSYFHNDSFWVVAPFKVFDDGVKRSIAKNEAGEEGLLVTYTSGGTTPGDSYLWHLDENGRPKGYQMWVDIIPIGGLYASWENWKTMESGITLSSLHTLLVLNIDIENLRAWN